MTDITPTGCPEGVDPEDVAAWALDGEPAAGTDLDTHVPLCPPCSAAAAQARAAAAVTLALRDAAEPAPPTVAATAVSRIRFERRAHLLATTLAGALLRLVRAVPDYLRAPSQPDTTAVLPPPPDAGGNDS